MFSVKKTLLILSIVFISFILIACNEETTDLTTEATTTTTTSTTNATTTSNTVTTTESTTVSTTEDVTTTEEQNEDYEFAEELFISINRLEEAVFEIDFSLAFSENKEESSASYFKNNYFPFYRLLGSGNEEEVYDNADYLQHPYWQEFLYHRDLFEMPALDNGMYRFARLLNSYNDLAMNNLYTIGEGVSTEAQNYADWAVNNIRVVNTWVEQDDNRYLLDYDDVNDVVNLYIIMDLDYLSCNSYRKISIYYNDIGEEVIEMWINEFYYDSSQRKVAVYYNSVAARDFNYYNAELDQDLQPIASHFRGVNLGDDGMYNYYDNTYNYISGDVGWYQILPFIDYDNGEISFYEYADIMAFSPDAASNVVRIMEGYDSYNIKLYLPAFNGVEALLIEENGLATANVDSQDYIDFFISEGLTPLPDYYGFSEESGFVTGIETANGRFLTSDEIFEDKLTLNAVTLDVAPEGDIDYMAYHKYLGVMEINVAEKNLNTVLSVLESYINDMGLEYKYGSLDQLFYELRMIEMNKGEVLKKQTFVSPVIGFNKEAYENIANFYEAREYIFNYINVSEELISLGTGYPTIGLNEQPTDNPLSETNLIDLYDKVSEEAVVDQSGIDLSSMSVDIPATPILRLGFEYSIYYALTVNNKVHIIEMETPQVYDGTDLHFDLSTLDLTSFVVPEGAYILSIFFGKTTTEGVARISNVYPVTTTEFEPVGTTFTDPVSNQTYINYIVYYSGLIVVNSAILDMEPPTIGVEGYEMPFQGLNEDPMPIQSHSGGNIIDLLSIITYVLDNVDGFMTLDHTNIYVNNSMVESLEQELVSGLYIISVFDSVGNITEIRFQVTLTYTISFETNGGTEVESMSQVSGATITAPAEPTLDGYQFDGWYTDVELTNPFTFDTMPEENIVLYAKWVEVPAV